MRPLGVARLRVKVRGPALPRAAALVGVRLSGQQKRSGRAITGDFTEINGLAILVHNVRYDALPFVEQTFSHRLRSILCVHGRIVSGSNLHLWSGFLTRSSIVFDVDPVAHARDSGVSLGSVNRVRFQTSPLPN